MEALPKGRKSSLVPRHTLSPSPNPLGSQPVPPSLCHLPCQEAGGSRATPGCLHFTSHDCVPPVFLMISMLSRLDLGL